MSARRGGDEIEGIGRHSLSLALRNATRPIRLNTGSIRQRLTSPVLGQSKLI